MTARVKRGERGGIGTVSAVLALVVVAVAGSGGVLLYARSQLDALSPVHDQPIAIEVDPGESLTSLAGDLDRHNLIKSSLWFTIYARYRGLDDKLHTGEYLIDDGMGASAIVAKFLGAPDLPARQLVLTEGMTAVQMAAVVGRGGFGVTAAQYLEEARNGTFAEPFLVGRPAGASLEGFLFPDTYAIPAHATAHSIIQMQLDTFAAKGLTALQGSTQRLSTYQLVVLASIVEREARDPPDRPLVAGVLSNRLAAGMLLQVDATVLYGIDVVGRSPTAAELQRDTPYNTYLHAGLPPTPIANPGRAALAAAAFPAQTPYLFYVSDACGHNHYSTTAAGQEQAISQYVGTPCS